MKNLHDYRSKGFGRGFLWLDLVNSLEWDGFGNATDHLNDSTWLLLFLRHWRMDQKVSRALPLREILGLRRLLRRAAEQWAGGKAIGARELAALNSVLSVAVEQKILQGQNGLRMELVPQRADGRWILSRIAESFAQTLVSGDGDRLKSCRNAGCKWFFYDTTKGNTRCWCKDSTCGNRDRVRRARAAHR
jgi:predicted RNA-binding Zn ribbon-like protein